MRVASLLTVPTLLLAATACSGGGHSVAAPDTLTVPASTPSDTSSPASGTPSAQVSSPPAATQGGPGSCQTSGLSLHLGPAGGAAGSLYEPIVFTNTGAVACTLYGYPGVAFVASAGGPQVGAAAFRNPQQPSTLVTLAPGASAAALLQVIDDANYPASNCQRVAVSGLRVYPPGNSVAAYLAFTRAATACSTQVNQLSIEATVSGSTGQ